MVSADHAVDEMGSVTAQAWREAKSTQFWLRPCMGGWCRRRDVCANFRASSERERPAERLCERGQDGVSRSMTVKLQPATMV